jgi:decaprenylphospho-beta-D-ribofuranose 2-oxidase
VRELNGWGRYPRQQAQVASPWSAAACAGALPGTPAALIARGLGRGYGDSALAHRVLSTERLDRFHAFDTESGLLTCDAGVSLDDILRVAIPAGWFLPVTPGTRFVTVGGAIASDVHGKNHHADGCFGAHVQQLAILLGTGECVTASRLERPDLFHASCGGMGLTGVILRATLQLKKIGSSDIVETTLRLPNLGALLEAFEAEASSPYSVAWIDCGRQGRDLGRSVLMLGEHAAEGPLEVPPAPRFAVPCVMPGAFLSAPVSRAFNAAYYAKAPALRTTRRVPASAFFYPLDAVRHWNRLYGAAGLVQYQFVLPQAAGPAPMHDILRRIAGSGLPSFLGVLKKLGPANGNLLSFPLEGYTLAVDFKAHPAVFELLDVLDAIVVHHGGRVYLAKDARMTRETFRAGYPRWEEFETVRERWQAHGRFASAQSRRLGLA